MENEIIPQNVNYGYDRYYKTAKYPIRQPIYLTWLIWVLSQIMLLGKEKKIERIGMEDLKPPYMILSNHLSFVDFELVALGTYPQRMNNVVNVDGYYLRGWLMEWIGSIGTRKFTSDIHLIKSIRKVLSRGDVLTMYPEARYSPCGVSSYLPESLGMLIKRCKVPIVVVMQRGNHLHMPAWNVKKPRKVPLHTTIKLALTVEDIERMSVEEINAFIKNEFTYDEYQYQKEKGILITEPTRAEGLHLCAHRPDTPFSQADKKTKIVPLQRNQTQDHARRAVVADIQSRLAHKPKSRKSPSIVSYNPHSFVRCKRQVPAAQSHYIIKNAGSK